MRGEVRARGDGAQRLVADFLMRQLKQQGQMTGATFSGGFLCRGDVAL